MRHGEPGAHLPRKLEGPRPGHDLAGHALELLSQGQSLEVLHDEAEVLPILKEVGDLDEVIVIDDPGDLRLVAEALEIRDVSGVLGVQHLDRHVTAEAGVPDAIDRGESSDADLLQDQVAVDQRLAAEV